MMKEGLENFKLYRTREIVETSNNLFSSQVINGKTKYTKTETMNDDKELLRGKKKKKERAIIIYVLKWYVKIRI